MLVRVFALSVPTDEARMRKLVHSDQTNIRAGRPYTWPKNVESVLPHGPEVSCKMALVWFELYDEPILLNLIHSLYILAGINRPWPIAIASPKIWPIFTGIARKIVDKWTADIEDPSATGRAIIDLVHCALFLDIFSFTPVELSRLRGLASHDTRIITSLASTCSYVFATVWQRRSLFPLRGALPSHF